MSINSIPHQASFEEEFPFPKVGYVFFFWRVLESDSDPSINKIALDPRNSGSDTYATKGSSVEGEIGSTRKLAKSMECLVMKRLPDFFRFVDLWLEVRATKGY